jgi:hypothetical protein
VAHHVAPPARRWHQEAQARVVGAGLGDGETHGTHNLDRLQFGYNWVARMRHAPLPHLTSEMIDQFLMAGLAESDAVAVGEHLRQCSDCRCRMESHKFWSEFSAAGAAERVK